MWDLSERKKVAGGVRLLARTTRRQSLTEAGATYLREARAILATVTSLETRLSEQSSTPSGVLKVTAPAPVGRRCDLCCGDHDLVGLGRSLVGRCRRRASEGW